MGGQEYLAKRGSTPVEIRELASKWSAIEVRMKEAEQVNEATLIDAINDLRLAGREIVKLLILLPKDSASNEESVQKDNIIEEALSALGVGFNL